MRPILRTDEERFFAKVERRPDGCWIWQGSTGGDGRYGAFGADRRSLRAHRWSYEHFTGRPIPPGCEIDHLCRVTLCVNPAHLEAVSHRENVLRGVGLAAGNVRKTHCPQGHPYDEANTRLYGRRRFCRACDLLRPRRTRTVTTTFQGGSS